MPVVQTVDRYRDIDALRGIAALMVLFFHLTYGANQLFDFRAGNTGVDLFFIISGFVIFLSLSRQHNVKAFLRSRFIRLFPTYWFCCTLTYLLIVLYFQVVDIRDFEVFPFADYLVNMTMLQHFFGIANVDQPYWTMAIELLFYAWMAFMALAGWMRFLNISGLLITIAVMAVCLMVPEPIRKPVTDLFPLLLYLPLFMSGILFYQSALANKKNVVTQLLILFFLASQIVLFPFTGRAIFLDQSTYALMILLFYLLFQLVSFRKLNFVVNPVTLFMGEISYAFYLIHQFITLNLLMPYFYEYLGVPYWITVFGIVIPVLLLLAAFVTRKIQYPAAAWLRRRSGNRQPVQE